MIAARMRLAIMTMAAVLITTPLMLHATPARAHAQAAAPVLEIVHAEHSAQGSLTLAIRADGGRETKVQSLTVFVDDVPVTLDLARRVEQRPVALIVLIDTSGSMAGAPIQAAREAARRLLDRLPQTDRVGLTAFAEKSAVLAPLTQDRQSVVRTLDSLQAGGATALYEAVTLAATQLSTVVDAQRVIVLLSDGRDSGNAPSAREDSIRCTKDAGVYVHAVGLGDDFDRAYLAELAAGQGGGLVAVRDGTDVSALSAIFARLGGTLGANERYTIPLTSLAQGTHRLRVRGLINGVLASAATTFDVTNAGLLGVVVLPGTTAGAPIQLHLDASVRGQDLVVEARVGTHTFLPRGDASTIDVDPWRLTPGVHGVEVVALARGVVAAMERVQIEVPTLSPSIDVTERDGSYIVRAHLQSPTPPSLVVRRSGVQLVRSAGEQVFPVSGDRGVIELLDASGAVVLTREVPATTEARVDAVRAAGGAGAAVMLAAGVAWWWLRWRRRKPGEEPPFLRRALRQSLAPQDTQLLPDDLAAPVPASRSIEAPVGMLVLRGGPADGREVPLTRRPLTVGSAPGCDIVIKEADIRPRHATISALPSGEVQVHGIAARGARPYLGTEEDEWIVMHDGEQVVFGGTSLQLVIAPRERAPAFSPPDPFASHTEA